MSNTTVPVSWTPTVSNSVLDLLVNDCDGTLTTDHAASSRGLPVLVVGVNGTAFGVAEVGELTVAVYPSLGHTRLTAGQIALIEAARSAGYSVRIPE